MLEKRLQGYGLPTDFIDRFVAAIKALLNSGGFKERFYKEKQDLKALQKDVQPTFTFPSLK